MVAAFPDLAGSGWPVKRSPNFTTVRYVSMSGSKTTAPKQTFPVWKWSIPYNFLRSAYFGSGAAFSELETLVGFFNARSADGAMFTYTDPEDFTVTGQGFGSGDGTSADFQLYRTYGGFTEPVYAATPTAIYVNGVAQVLGVDYNISDTGVVSFTLVPAVADILTWDGTFGFYCRFDDDALDLQRIAVGLFEAGSALNFSSELNL